MRIVYGLLALVSLALVGCGEAAKNMPAAPSPPPAVAADPMPASEPYADGGGTATASDSKPALGTTLPPGIEAGVLPWPLSPANTQIEFVGTHVGEKPDPRKGTFEKFTGLLQVDLAAKSLKSLAFDIDMDSVATEFPKLTDHLKSPDFFEVREHPKATFASTKIAASTENPGQLQITGNLTLHGVTKEITAPATVQIGPDGPSLKSEFTLDRSEFGMTFSPDKVENKVALTVVMSQKAPSSQP